MHHRQRLLILTAPLMFLATAWAGASADETLKINKMIDVGGTGLGAFDISFVDPRIELYTLADRTNGSVDLIDSEAASFLGRIGSICPAGNPAPHFCF